MKTIERIIMLALILGIWIQTSWSGETYKFLKKWGSKGSDDGQFNHPRGIAIDSAGNVYVADTWNHRIQKFDANGTFLKKLGSKGSDNGQFYDPYGIAVNTDGNVYVVDIIQHRIQKFDSAGNFLTKWGSYGNNNGQFNHPFDIAVDNKGNVYVTDTGVQDFCNHRIQKFDSADNFLTKWGKPGSNDSEFNYPSGITVDSNNNVYVVDTGNNRIQKFDTNGNFAIKWINIGASDIASDSFNNIYVVDADGHCVKKLNPEGHFLAKWGNEGSGDGQFNYPHGIAVDSNGNVYVADTENNRIQKFGLVQEKINSAIFSPKTKLLQSYPNPFNPECWIPYELKNNGDVKIRIYNVLGQKIRELDLGSKIAGQYITKDKSAYWDGKDSLGKEVVSGIYYYELVVDSKVIGMKKGIVLK